LREQEGGGEEKEHERRACKRMARSERGKKRVEEREKE
jgi:hypothetical protein